MTLKKISAYRSAYDLIADEGFLPDNITGGFQDFLQHCDDFEATEYYCINHCTVICADSINGDVFATFCNATEFMDKLFGRYLDEEEDG